MTPPRALVVALLVILVAVSHLWTKHPTPAPATAVAQPRVATTSVLDEVATSGAKVEGVRDDDWAEPRVDLNGNEIDDAVGDYRVDVGGEMYERHAPDTALPHLAAPSL